MKFDYIFNNQYEEIPDYLNRESEDKFKILKRTLSNDNNFKTRHFPEVEGKIINDFRIAGIGKDIILFIYKEKGNIFNRCETYIIDNKGDVYEKR